MDAYERQRYDELRIWQAEPPPVTARLLGRAAGPASRAVQTVIPVEALQLALDAVFKLSGQFDGEDALLRRGGVDQVEALQHLQLRQCDDLARHVQQRAALVGAGTGAAFGVAGVAGLIADVPTLLTLALRVIRRVGYCYGEKLQGPLARRLAITIFALASANSVAEKRDALQALATIDHDDADVAVAAWRDGIERAAERELAKDAASASLNNLAAQLTRHLGWRKASGLVPVMGAVIGGSVNAWYLHDVARVARYSFQQRWLRRRYPTSHSPIAIAPLPG